MRDAVSADRAWVIQKPSVGRHTPFTPPAYADRYEALFTELSRLFAAGDITHRPHVVEGIEQVAKALELLLTGGNHGKLMVAVSADPWAES